MFERRGTPQTAHDGRGRDGRALVVPFAEGGELRAGQRENTAPSMTSSIAYAPEVTAMDGGNPYPPVKKY